MNVMNRIAPIVAGVVLLAAPAPALAQNREHTQIYADLRMLQEQVQRLQLALNQLAEQLKTTQQALAAQAGETKKGFADQAVAVGNVSSALGTVREAERDTAIRVAQLNQEMKAIRDGLGMQQTMLGQILDLLQPKPVPADPVNPTDPAAPRPPTPLPPPTGGTLPPSPSSYYNLAWSAYTGNQFEEAIRLYESALKQFPDAVEAASARYNLGEAYLHLDKTKEALEVFRTVPKLHPDSEEVPNAYYKQGMCYERLNQRADAEKSYQLVRTRYPDSPAASLATQRLKSMGVIK
jgi:tol-pal system protein YbgF